MKFSHISFIKSGEIIFVKNLKILRCMNTHSDSKNLLSNAISLFELMILKQDVSLEIAYFVLADDLYHQFNVVMNNVIK